MTGYGLLAGWTGKDSQLVVTLTGEGSGRGGKGRWGWEGGGGAGRCKNSQLVGTLTGEGGTGREGEVQGGARRGESSERAGGGDTHG